MRPIALALKLLVGAALAASGSAAFAIGRKDVRLHIDDDPFCGRTPQPDSPKGFVKSTMMPIPPDRLLGMQRPGDAFVSGRVRIDANGDVTSVEIFQQVPEGRGLDEMFEDSMMKWKFAPGSVAEFCSSVAIDFNPSRRDVDSGEVWADVDYPVSPKPTEAQPLGYPPDAYAAGIGGTVTLFIEISPEGGLRKAVVKDEEPKDQLFGAAALEGVQTWRFDGATPGRYRLKVRFKPDPANAPAELPAQ